MPNAAMVFGTAFSVDVDCVRRTASWRRFATAILIITVVVGASPVVLTAQPLEFEHLSVRDGLSSNTVYCAIQDQRGFLWFCTPNGLNRYDGYGFTVYTHDEADSISLSEDVVYPLYVDKGGTLWIGTNSGGLNRFDYATETFTRYTFDANDRYSLSHNTVKAIYEDQFGALWVGTEEGLNKFDRTHERFVRYAHDSDNADSLRSSNITALRGDRQGNLWIGTFGGGIHTYHHEEGRFQRYQHSADTTDEFDKVLSILEDSDGIIWIGSWGGLSRYDPVSQRFTHYTQDAANRLSLSHNRAISLFEDQGGILWIGTYHGLNRTNRRRDLFTSYVNEPNNSLSLSHNIVTSVFQDQSGVYWATTNGGGINRFTLHPEIAHYRHVQADATSLHDNNVRTVYEDRAGRVWIGTDTGISTFDRSAKTFTRYPIEQGGLRGSSDNMVEAILKSKADRLWMGTYNGLYRYDLAQSRLVHYLHRREDGSSLSHNRVSTLLEDRGGMLWVGTREGLNRLDPETRRFTQYLHRAAEPGSLSDNSINVVYESRDGAIWIGTRQGLNVYDREKDQVKLVAFNAAGVSAKNDDFINAIFEDHTGKLWLATARGLKRYDPESGRLASFAELEGLPSQWVLDVQGDRQTLWVLTAKGLARVDMATYTSIHYDLGGAFQESDVRSHLTLSETGELLLGGPDGLIVFHPDSVRIGLHAPPIVLTDLRVMNEPAKLDGSVFTADQVTLAHNENFISIEYAALDYTDVARNQYAYMLEGVDKDWVFAGTRRVVNYSNLIPGVYTFRLRGANSAGIWNEEGATLQIVIKPAFWQTWWFRFLIVPGLLVAMLAAAYRYRVGKLLEMERMRLRIAGDLHDDIGSNVSSIALMSEMLYDGAAFDDAERRRLLRINQTAGETIGALREIIWFVDPDHDKLGDVIRKMRAVAGDLLAGIPYTFQAPDQLPSRPLSMEFRRNVYLMYKEMLHNVVKHAQAGHVAIEIEHERGVFVLRVEDDGVGFDEDGVAQGHGLKSIRRRAERAGGTVEIVSPTGRGTRIIFSKEMENGVKARWQFWARWRK